MLSDEGFWSYGHRRHARFVQRFAPSTGGYVIVPRPFSTEKYNNGRRVQSSSVQGENCYTPQPCKRRRTAWASGYAQRVEILHGGMRCDVRDCHADINSAL